MPSPNGSNWWHRVSLSCDPTSPGAAREFVRTQLLAHGLPALMDDMELVVSELATNAFLHARTASAVTLERQGSTVLLTVEDYGSGFEPSTRRSSATDVAGRGLMITDLVSDGWGVVDGGRQPTSVWASFSTRTYP